MPNNSAFFLSNKLRKFILFFAAMTAPIGQTYANDFVYIVNGNGTVSVFDTANFNMVLGTPFDCISPNPLTPMGMDQIVITVSPDGSRAYVPAFQDANTVAVLKIDPYTGALSNIVPPVGGFNSPFGAAVSPDGNFVYITNFGNNTVQVCDKDLNFLGPAITIFGNLGSSATAIVTSPDGSRVYISSPGLSQIATFTTSPSPPYLIGPPTIVPSAGTPYVVAAAPDGYVYVSHFSNDIISKFNADLTLPAMPNTIATGVNGLIGIAFDPNGDYIYTVSPSNNQIVVIDAATFTLPVTVLPSQGVGALNPFDVAIDPQGLRLYVTNKDDGTLSVRELSHPTYPIITTMPLSLLTRPYGIGFSTQQPSISPTTLTGKQKKNDSGVLFELFNSLKWNHPDIGQIAGFFVYRNGTKIATLSPSTLTYEDHNRKKGDPDTYAVTSFDQNGNESAPITVEVK